MPFSKIHAQIVKGKICESAMIYVRINLFYLVFNLDTKEMILITNKSKIKRFCLNTGHTLYL